MSARQRTSSGGGLGALLLVGFIVFVLLALGSVPMDDSPSALVLGEVQVQERADNHVVEKHGVAARDVLQRPGSREYWYSMQREAVMIAKCDGTNCACMFVAGRGLPWGRQPFNPAWLNGQLELSTYFMSAQAKGRMVLEQGYQFLGTW